MHVSDLQKLLDAETELHDIAFDMEEVRLVNREIVRFLAACEAKGIELKNCPTYIREWIETGSNARYERRC